MFSYPKVLGKNVKMTATMAMEYHVPQPGPCQGHRSAKVLASSEPVPFCRSPSDITFKTAALSIACRSHATWQESRSQAVNPQDNIMVSVGLHADTRLD